MSETVLRDKIAEKYHPRAAVSGQLIGPQITQRKVAHLAHDAGFRDTDLYIACMVCGAESWRFQRAYNDNLDADNHVVSRDVGLMEINIPASQIGTPKEEELYDPVKNFARAWDLFLSRKWQPWAAFNSGVYLHDTYLQWALLGVANFAREQMIPRQEAIGYNSKTRLPWITLAEVKKLYPDVVLG